MDGSRETSRESEGSRGTSRGSADSLPEGATFLADDMAAGPQPTPEELDLLAEGGFRTVVNLRRSGESDQRLSPEEEGDRVRALDMDYFHLPVDPEAPEPSEVERFRSALDDLPGPAYVHCDDGGRAGAFAAMREAVRRGVSGEEALRRARRYGYEYDEKMEALVRDYVDGEFT